jgi:hypothetical protein
MLSYHHRFFGGLDLISSFAAKTGLLLDLALDALGHLILLYAGVHPLRFLILVVACNIKSPADSTYRIGFVAFFAPKQAGPAAIRGPHGGASLSASIKTW